MAVYPRPMPAVTPIEVSESDLAQVRYDDAGLVPAIVQEEGTGDVLDDGVDERDHAAPHAGGGAHRVLEPVPPGGVAQGRHLRRPPVRAGQAATTATATRCCSSSSRRARAPATPAPGPASSGTSAPVPEADGPVIRPDRDDLPGPRPRPHRRARVARGAGRPGHPGRRLRPAVPGRRARLPARVGGARGALGPVVVRRPPPGGQPGGPGPRGLGRGARCGGRGRRPAPRPGHPRRRRGPAGPHPHARGPRPAAAPRRAPRLPRLRRRPRGGAPARRPPRRAGPARRGPVGHRGDRGVRPLAPAGHPRGQRHRGAGATPIARSTRPTTTPCRRLDELAARRGPSPRRAAARAARPRRRPPRGHLDPGRGRLRASGGGGPGAHPRRRHLPGRARRSASTSELDADPFDVYRVLRQLNPQPVHVLRAPARGDPGGLVARADGAAARRAGDVPAHRRHPLPGPHRGGGPSPRGRAPRAPQGGRPST